MKLSKEMRDALDSAVLRTIQDLVVPGKAALSVRAVGPVLAMAHAFSKADQDRVVDASLQRLRRAGRIVFRNGWRVSRKRGGR